MHRDIKRFGFSGQINDDSDFIRLRAQWESMIIHQMRDDGYVPVLEFGPLFSTKYVDGSYEFTLTVYGVYTGKKKSWNLEGMDGNGRFLPRSTANHK